MLHYSLETASYFLLSFAPVINTGYLFPLSEWRNNMSKFLKIFLSIVVCIVLLGSSIPGTKASAAPSFSLVILSKYNATLRIGDTIRLYAVTSNGKKASWKSSDSKIASVNTYGTITAKKSGSALITAKIKDAEASCRITVSKTKITLSNSRVKTERGQTFRLSAKTSNNSSVSWKSTKRSIATVNEYGTVTALKPGTTQIIATANGSSISCDFTVLTPSIKLNKNAATLYRGGSTQLSASVSSKLSPVWKSNKPSVATVTKTGLVQAVKNGSAKITATIDGEIAECMITIQKPDITLNKTEITMKKGTSTTIAAQVSSGNKAIWSTSNTSVVSINSRGELKALSKGKAYIYASEDGTKVRCSVIVTD